LGFGFWVFGPNPKPPIPNPQSPILFKFNQKNFVLFFNLLKILN